MQVGVDDALVMDTKEEIFEMNNVRSGVVGAHAGGYAGWRSGRCGSAGVRGDAGGGCGERVQVRSQQRCAHVAHWCRAAAASALRSSPLLYKVGEVGAIKLACHC